MRLVTWNCNGGFRGKLHALDAMDADILVIQECEDPLQSSDAYRSWAGNHLWLGYGKNKGIGIFPRRGQSIERLAWPDHGFELFLPARIGGKIDVLGVWTQQVGASKLDYIGQFWHYLKANKTMLEANAILAGDFNSNTIWDRPRRAWNHSDCVRELEALGFYSLYHHVSGEAQGQERQPTFYLHRHASKPFHMDFVFAHKERLNPDSCAVRLGEPAEWLPFSDHMPIVVDL